MARHSSRAYHQPVRPASGARPGVLRALDSRLPEYESSALLHISDAALAFQSGEFAARGGQLVGLARAVQAMTVGRDAAAPETDQARVIARCGPALIGLALVGEDTGIVAQVSARDVPVEVLDFHLGQIAMRATELGLEVEEHAEAVSNDFAASAAPTGPWRGIGGSQPVPVAAREKPTSSWADEKTAGGWPGEDFRSSWASEEPPSRMEQSSSGLSQSSSGWMNGEASRPAASFGGDSASFKERFGLPASDRPSSRPGGRRRRRAREDDNDRATAGAGVDRSSGFSLSAHGASGSDQVAFGDFGPAMGGASSGEREPSWSPVVEPAGGPAAGSNPLRHTESEWDGRPSSLGSSTWQSSSHSAPSSLSAPIDPKPLRNVGAGGFDFDSWLAEFNAG
ncbi:hypothetical protein CATYP_07580 [Corynebacterium atypicum]|uniref:Roadblock/LAMTOR2 domain-containing protein n=1 Tax=Corynebacterium atypicum TaxID=191610 RepID=A0ABM5QP06_9CORY|nr:hypothetical protein [Corynebacterium atypicum]AIG64470.1 hypothetical protein CATYP_07580 [Corynebacterium atypicum]